MQRFGSWPACIALALFFFLPLLSLLPEAWSDGGHSFAHLFGDRLFWQGLANTLLLGLLSGGMSVVVGSLIAIQLARQPQQRRGWMIMLLGLPLAFSGLVIAYGFILAFGRAGFVTQSLEVFGIDPASSGSLLYSLWGLALAYAYYLIPRVALTLYPVFANFDVRSLHAARTMGASPLRAAVEIALPQVYPAILQSGCVVAAIAMGTYGTALAMVGAQINILPLQLYQKVSDGGSDLSEAAALSLVLLVCCSTFIGIGDAVARRRQST
ncbi:ABC transporter permease [Herbaspirillum rubrisubalbicans]|uniref:ABC transporter permease n=1 Tax=Herbaspirillum rubrisubalbicans TaxID=80842 RepID=A0AAD0XFM3_9BURK|nr:ABC transporter permease subunit [Herbaspirillum rubrisubalbicans]AYR23617.1 ABC transporter permease [Herbaspirillum rubrisubalbicans]